MKKRTKMSMLVAASAAACATMGAAVVSCCCNEWLPPRPIPWAEDTDPTDRDAGGTPQDAGGNETGRQIHPSKELLIASGAVSSVGWPLAYVYVRALGADGKVAFGPENFAFVSVPKTFTGNFSIGPAVTPVGGLGLADWSTTYCKPTVQSNRYVRTATLSSCAALTGTPAPTSGTSKMLIGNDNKTVTLSDGGTATVSVGKWVITNAAGTVVGAAHVFGGSEYWVVSTRAPTEPNGEISSDKMLHYFTQAPANAAKTLQNQWDEFRSSLCGDAGPGVVVYNVSTQEDQPCP